MTASICHDPKTSNYQTLPRKCINSQYNTQRTERSLAINHEKIIPEARGILGSAHGAECLLPLSQGPTHSRVPEVGLGTPRQQQIATDHPDSERSGTHIACSSAPDAHGDPRYSNGTCPGSQPASGCGPATGSQRRLSAVCVVL